MSGWPEIDYDPATWIELPRIWCEQTWPDHRAWARDIAQACWADSGLTPGEHEVDNLTLTLAMYVERERPEEKPNQDIFFHLPDPRLMPLPVYLDVWDVEGEREAMLRELTWADDPGTVEPRSLRHSRPNTWARDCVPCGTAHSILDPTTHRAREHHTRRHWVTRGGWTSTTPTSDCSAPVRSRPAHPDHR